MNTKTYLIITLNILGGTAFAQNTTSYNDCIEKINRFYKVGRFDFSPMMFEKTFEIHNTNIVDLYNRGCIGCNHLLSQQLKTRRKIVNQNDTSFTIKLTAIDLSENVSRLSTNNDEIILLIYQDSAGQQIPDLLHKAYFIIDSTNSTKNLSFHFEYTEKSKLTFVLLEMDSRKNLQQIEPIIRMNLYRIIEARRIRNTEFIHTILADDDLLGIRQIDSYLWVTGNLPILFKGYHLFDSWEYKIEKVKKT